MAVQNPIHIVSNKIDSLRVVINNLNESQQVLSAKIDSVSDLTSNMVINQSDKAQQIDSINAQLKTISEYGIGFSDVAAHIAIPLIIALFAFAFTYLFSVITRINEKYNSENISKMFKKSCAYQSYMWCSAISVGYIIVMGFISLIFKGNGYHLIMSFLNWSCLFVAGVYSSVILWFVHTCLQYDDHQQMFSLIIERYQKDKKSPKALNERTNRLIDLCRYAIREHNSDLFTSLLQSINELNRTEKNEEVKYVSYYTMTFYENIVDGFILTPHAGETENSLLWNWFQTLKHDKLPFSGTIYGMLGKMVEASKQGRFSLFETYIDNSRLGYDFINRIPFVSYAIGQSTEDQIKTDKERMDLWRELRETHFLAAAYLFSIGHYEVAGALNKGIGYNRETVFPSNTSAVLKIYADCKSKQDKETGAYHGYWEFDKVIGHKYDKDLLEKFTALMLLLSLQPEEDKVYIVDDNRLKIIEDSKDELLKFGGLWEKHPELLIRYPIISEQKIEKKYKEAIKNITTGDMSAGKRRRKKWNVYSLEIKETDEKPVRDLFNTILYSNRMSITDGLYSEIRLDKNDEIAMGAYTFLTSKIKILNLDIWQDHGTFNELMRLFGARYTHILFEAYSKMKVKDIKVKWSDFEKLFIKHTMGKGDQYVIVDTGCSMDHYMSMDKSESGWSWVFNKHYKGAYYYEANIRTAYYFRDNPWPKSFDESITIARIADLPALESTNDNEKPDISFVDESDKEKGRSAVRITVDPCIVAKYSKNAEILRVKIVK